jgi:hypothetical protein
MKFVTIFKFKIESVAPISTDRMGELLSRMTREVMETKDFKGNIKMTTVSIDPAEANRLEP